MRPIICIAAAVVSFCAAAPARAQNTSVIMGAMEAGRELSHARRARREAACMAGQVPKATDIAEAQLAATAALQRYLHLAAGGAPADTTAAFTRDTERRHWLRGGAEGVLSAVDDPLARLLARHAFALPEPDSFALSGDRDVALGVWRVAGDGDAEPAGYYRVRFRQARQSWTVENLEIVEGAAAPGPARQFCHFPGDAEEAATVHQTGMADARLVQDHKAAGRAVAADKGLRLRTIAAGK